MSVTKGTDIAVKSRGISTTSSGGVSIKSMALPKVKDINAIQDVVLWKLSKKNILRKLCIKVKKHD